MCVVIKPDLCIKQKNIAVYNIGKIETYFKRI